MATRKLVEIFGYNYRQFQAIQRFNRKVGLPVPSVPFLVNEAIKVGLPSISKRFTPPPASNDTENKISAK